MLNLIRKDLLLAFSNKSIVFILLFYIPFISILMSPDTPTLPLFISLVTFTHMITTIPFGYEVKGKPHIMIQSLPVKTRNIVISKYILIFVNYIIAIVYTFIYLWIMSLFGSSTIDNFSISIIKETLTIVILSLSVSLPLLFRLPPKIASFANIFIYISLVNYFDTIIVNKKNIFPFSNSNISVLTVLIVVYFLSMGISLWLYKNKDL